MPEPMTTNQKNFIDRLNSERVIEQDRLRGDAVLQFERLLDVGGGKFVSKFEASRLIDWLLSQPKQAAQPRADKPADLLPGVFETNGAIYLVRYTKDGERLYACRLVELNTAERLTEIGTVIPVDFEYDRGAIFNIKPEHRLSLERARELSIRYGRCIICTRHLKAAKSVEQGIGPVCVKTQLGARMKEAA